jgi:hypothetical protein
MNSTKQKLLDNLVIGIIIGAVSFLVLQYVLVHVFKFPVNDPNATQSYKDVGGNIDIEYYLEVSEDSIWVENVQSHKVYGGTYSELDSLIQADNL